MSKGGKVGADRIDRFFAGPGARGDQWRKLVELGEGWSAGTSDRSSVETALAEMTPTEEFHAYPGGGLMAALRDRVASGAAGAAAMLARRISTAILTRTYKHRAAEWETAEHAAEAPLHDVVSASLGAGEARRPYFEMLVVSPADAGRRQHHVNELRRLRRSGKLWPEGAPVSRFLKQKSG